MMTLPGLDEATSYILYFTFAWMLVGFWSVFRFSQLASGTLANKITAAGPVFMGISGPGLVLALLAFLSNFLVLLGILHGAGLPDELAELVGSIVQYMSPIGEILGNFIPGAAYWIEEKYAYRVALAVVVFFVLLSEILLLPGLIACKRKTSGRQSPVLDKIEGNWYAQATDAKKKPGPRSSS